MTPYAPEESGTVDRPTLWGLFRVCFWIGLFSFGGGLTAWVHREVVEQRRWMTNDEFLNGVTLGQVLPGANVTNLVVYIGQRLIGPAGAAAGLLGLLLGPFLAVIGLATLYETFSGLAWLHRALEGAAAAAIGLLVVLAIKSARHAVRGWIAFCVILATVFAIAIMQWPLLPVVVTVAVASIALTWARMAA